MSIGMKQKTPEKYWTNDIFNMLLGEAEDYRRFWGRGENWLHTGAKRAPILKVSESEILSVVTTVSQEVESRRVSHK